MVPNLLSLTVTLALLAPPAVAGPPRGADAPGPEHDGIARARAAGIYVDPKVEDMMARAPIGSCANAPTLAKCPPARAIVFAGASESPRPSAFAPLLTDSTATLGDDPTPAGIAAVAAGPGPQCGVHISPESPRRSLLRARMDAQNYCLPTVSRHEMYSELFKFWDFQWVQMKTDWHAAAGGQRIDVSTYYRCTKLVRRFWRAQADAYALLRGVWYGATQARQADLICAS